MTKSLMSFYQRTLPSTCTRLSSPEGQAIFGSAFANGGCNAFFPLIEQFTTQTEPAFCGLSTLVVVLNGLAVDPRRTWKGPWRWYEESMLNCCEDLEKIKEKGITFRKFCGFARCQGLKVDEQFAADSSVEEFRNYVKRSCMATGEENDQREFIVVSYTRKVLQQTGSGHFSPIAAFDPVSDAVLILDVARFKYGPHWVPLTLLFEAMLEKDPDDNAPSRGYTLLSAPMEEGMPQSILFRVRPTLKEGAGNALTSYKDFVEEIERNGKEQFTWNDAVKYWTKNRTSRNFVWKVIQPQLSPVTPSEIETVNAILSLVNKLLERQEMPTHFDLKCCCGEPDCSADVNVANQRNPQPRPCSRTIPISAATVLYILYLASMGSPEMQRSAIEKDSSFEIDDSLVQQLIEEAAFLRLAMDHVSQALTGEILEAKSD